MEGPSSLQDGAQRRGRLWPVAPRRVGSRSPVYKAISPSWRPAWEQVLRSGDSLPRRRPRALGGTGRPQGTLWKAAPRGRTGFLAGRGARPPSGAGGQRAGGGAVPAAPRGPAGSRSQGAETLVTEHVKNSSTRSVPPRAPPWEEPLPSASPKLAPAARGESAGRTLGGGRAPAAGDTPSPHAVPW